MDLDDLPDVVKIEKRVINILVLENSLCLVVIVVLLEGTKEKVRVGTAYLAPENDVSNRILSEIHRIAWIETIRIIGISSSTELVRDLIEDVDEVNMNPQIIKEVNRAFVRLKLRMNVQISDPNQISKSVVSRTMVNYKVGQDNNRTSSNLDRTVVIP